MLKVAILGFGFMGRLHAQAFAQMPQVELVGVAGCSPERLVGNAPWGKVQFFSNCDALLDGGANIVDICLPTFLHEEFAVAAAKRGLHILCEKPLALSVAAVDRILAAVNHAGITLMVAQVLRFFPQYAKCRDLVLHGALGNVSFAYASRLSSQPRWADWFQDPQKSGGALFDLLVHDLDYIVSLFGIPQSVYASGLQSQSGAWDHVSVLLSYKSKRVCLEASYRMPSGWPFTSALRLIGSKASIECQFRISTNVDDVKRAEKTLAVYSNEGPAIHPQLEDVDPYLSELSYFVDAIARGEKPEAVPLEDARDVIAILEAAKQSLETGAVVRCHPA